jgi:uncharacterized protein (TIGR00661 family)
MKILYGVQGTGNGHISRSRMMAKYFARENADVTYLFSGRDEKNYFDMEVFEQRMFYRGLSFNATAGQINYWKTIKENNLWEFFKDITTLPVEDYDLIISDFEPITAWAGKLKAQQVLGIGHQYAFGPRSHSPVAGQDILSSLVMNNFAPVSTGIGLHWHHYDSLIVPPIVDTDLCHQPGSNSILVYLPFDDQVAVTEVLQQFKGKQFIQYSPDLDDRQIDNVSLRRSCHHQFKRDLAESDGVICGAGFELISECLHIGVPVLAKPVRGQTEQLSNALALEKLGYAKIMTTVNRNDIGQWLATKKMQPPKPMPNVAATLVDWILNSDRKDPQQLVEQLWPEITGTYDRYLPRYNPACRVAAQTVPQ